MAPQKVSSVWRHGVGIGAAQRQGARRREPGQRRSQSSDSTCQPRHHSAQGFLRQRKAQSGIAYRRPGNTGTPRRYSRQVLVVHRRWPRKRQGIRIATARRRRCPCRILAAAHRAGPGRPGGALPHARLHLRWRPRRCSYRKRRLALSAGQHPPAHVAAWPAIQSRPRLSASATRSTGTRPSPGAGTAKPPSGSGNSYGASTAALTKTCRFLARPTKPR